MDKKTKFTIETLDKKYSEYSDRALLEKQTFDIEETRYHTSRTANILAFVLSIYILGIVIAIFAMSKS